jgi:competence protein ComEA
MHGRETKIGDGAGRQTRAKVLASLRASPWLAIGGRVAGAALAIVLFAWLGRTAAADGWPLGAASVHASGTASAQPPAPAPAPAPPPAPAPAPAPAPPAAAPAARGRATPEDPVYLNVADEADLRRLPGVGPKRAAAILALRQRIGRFTRVEELLRIRGIGRKTVKKWRPLDRLAPPPTPPAPPPGPAGADAGAGATASR